MTQASKQQVRLFPGTPLLAPERSCELCDGERFETIGEQDRHGQELETVVCSRCGLVSHARIPTDEELARYYATKYRTDYNGEETPSPRRVVREWSRGEERFARLQPYLQTGDRIFEIGAGIGCNLKHFELAGFEATGIEPGLGFGRYSREQLHCRVQPGYWQELPKQPAFDVVLLIHVFEHLHTPCRALHHIRETLRPGGRLCIEVPNLAAPHAAPGKQFHYAHIYNYTPWTLAAMAESCGYEVTRVFSADRERNLSLLLTRSNRFSVNVPVDGYLRTMQAMRRYNRWSYHARPSYLWERCGEIGRALGERLQAPAELQKILSRCAA